MPAPQVAILAGPNGAGKTTLSASLVYEHFGICEFVNADIIAHGLSRFDPEGQALAAGRLMLARLKDLSDNGQTFAFETTLASRSFAPFIRRCKERGYRFVLTYIWLPSADEAIRRVHLRVEQGGHFVPDDTVRRRYQRGLKNFFTLYQPLADVWQVYNGASAFGSALIATGVSDHTTAVDDAACWDHILKSSRHDP